MTRARLSCASLRPRVARRSACHLTSAQLRDRGAEGGARAPSDGACIACWQLPRAGGGGCARGWGFLRLTCSHGSSLSRPALRRLLWLWEGRRRQPGHATASHTPRRSDLRLLRRRHPHDRGGSGQLSLPLYIYCCPLSWHGFHEGLVAHTPAPPAPGPWRVAQNRETLHAQHRQCAIQYNTAGGAESALVWAKGRVLPSILCASRFVEESQARRRQRPVDGESEPAPPHPLRVRRAHPSREDDDFKPCTGHTCSDRKRWGQSAEHSPAKPQQVTCDRADAGYCFGAPLVALETLPATRHTPRRDHAKEPRVLSL